MKSSRLEKDKNKDNIIKDVKDLLKLKRGIYYNTI